jgi:predicted amidohydrolase YtcJ
MALQQLGISWHTPERVCDVWIDRDSNGELTGIVRGSVTNYYTHDPFWMQVWDKLPLPPDEIWEHGGRAGMAAMNALGVTTIYEAHAIEPEHIKAYQVLNRSGAMNCRVLTSLEAADMAFHPHYRPTPEQLQERLELALSMTELDDNLLRHNGITVARSGPCGPGFINLYEPFKSAYGELIYGYEFLPKWVEEQTVNFCMESGLRMNILAAAPKDHDDFFDSVKEFSKEEIRKREWILQHALMINEHDAARYAELGIHVTTCKGFHWGKGEMWGERIGKHTWKDLIPLRRWLDHGVTVGCGTDWGPRNIFEQIQLAVTCEFAGSGHRNLDAGQAITIEEALMMWTRDAAKVLGWKGVGTLAKDNFADLTIVDRNPLTSNIEELAETNVLRTIFAGEPVFDDGSISRNPK